MSSADNVLYHAAARVGYYAPDDPEPGSESGRYLANRMGQPWLAGPSWEIYWCACFVSMCLDLAGEINAIGGFYYNTDTLLNHNRDKVISKWDAQPGDIVLFDWHGDGSTDHVGIVEANLGGGVLQTIEGNTSSGAYGSQSAGNGVWRRHRSEAIAAVVRPAYSDAGGSVSVSDAIEVDGWWGGYTTRKLQWTIGTPVDGIVSSQYSPNQEYCPNATNGWMWDSIGEGSLMIAELQRRIGAGDDGLVGPETATKLQGYLGVNEVSSANRNVIGPETVKALQAKLNSGSF